jgi:hypothetical protein
MDSPTDRKKLTSSARSPATQWAKHQLDELAAKGNA